MLRHLNCGFTLIEILLVLGMITMIGTAFLFFDMNNYRADAFRAERDTLVTSLQTARAQAQNNVAQKSHGVALQPEGYDGFVLFEGANYESSLIREPIPSNYTVTFGSTTPPEIVFQALSGNANYSDITITLIDPERNLTENIFINHEGAIIW